MATLQELYPEAWAAFERELSSYMDEWADALQEALSRDLPGEVKTGQPALPAAVSPAAAEGHS